MTRHWKYLLPALGVALIACGNTTTGPSPGTAIWGALKSTATSLGQSPKPETAPNVIDRASIEKQKGPVYLVKVVSLDAVGTIVKLTRQNGVDTFVSADGGLFNMQSGIVVSTHGFAQNLLAHDMGALRTQLRGSGGNVTRKLKHFGPEAQAVTRTFSCTVSRQDAQTVTLLGKTHKTRKFTETCSDDQGQFENAYWMEGGIVRQSTQWLGDGLGQVIFQKLQ